LFSCSQEETCLVASDCDDGDFCSQDRCKLGRCSYISLPDCCHSNQSCTDETKPLCDPEINRCVQCREDKDCEQEQECNPLFHRCQPITGPLGAPCLEDAQCESHWCLEEATNGFPGGFCAQACKSPEGCSSRACIGAWGENGTCLPPCEQHTDCRPEYMCLPVDATHSGCFPHCEEPSHCPVVGSCNPWIGLCWPEVPGNSNGERCASDADCNGFCMTEEHSGAPEGICFSICSLSKTKCPESHEACVWVLTPSLQGMTVCLPVYDPSLGCREYYVPLLALDLTTQQPTTVCQPACQPQGCQSGICNVYSGLCNDDPGERAKNGSPCQVHTDCKGICMNFWPGGYCTSPCDLSQSNCPGDDVCMDLGLQTSCGSKCDNDQDCRYSEGYLCHTFLKCCVPGS